MCGSKARRWIIGLIVLAVAVLVAAGILMSRRSVERADKGTLVWAIEDELEAVYE